MTEPNVEKSVIVIESPSPDDILADRREGYALMSALNLANIPSRYLAVSNLETFKKAISIASAIPMKIHEVDRSGQIVSTRLIRKNLHISAHGNEHGIALTDGTFLPWVELAEQLDGLNKYDGYLNPSVGKPRGMVVLAMSSCKGYYAKDVLSARTPSPVCAVVGGMRDVAWPDALTAWITYYHLLLTKGCTGKVAVDRMNASAFENEEVFKGYMEAMSN